MKSHTALTTIAHGMHLLGVLLFVAVLYFARELLMPLTLGGLLAFLLTPLVNRLQRLGLSNLLAVLITAVMVFAIFSALLGAVWTGTSRFVEDLPQYRDELTSKINSVQSLARRLGGGLDEISAEIADPEDEASEQAEEEGEGASANNPWDRLFRSIEQNVANDGSSPKRPLYVKSMSGSQLDLRTWAGGLLTLLGPLGTAGLVTVFALFALLYRDDLRDRFTAVVSRGNYVVTAEALNEASARIGKYLVAQLIVNVSYGLIFSLGLWAIGYFFTPTGVFPYVPLLGTLAAVARFVPYLGPIVGAALPLVISIIVFPGYEVTVAVAVMIVVWELVSNNILEPWLYGSSTGVSPVAVILAAVFWGWLWGPVGLLLATPLTVCAVVLGQYVPRFRFLQVLLSDSVQMTTPVRGYQRLLAGDAHKLADFLMEEAKQQRPVRLLDRLVVPMVKLILRDNDKHGSDELLFGRLAEGLQQAGLMDSEPLDSKSLPWSPPDIQPTDDLVSVGSAIALATAGQPVESKGATALDAASDTTVQPQARILGVASRHVGETIVLRCLAKQLLPHLQLDIVSQEEVADWASSSPETMVAYDSSLVLNIPPQGVRQTRDIVRTLRAAGQRGAILACCPGKYKRFDRLYSQLRSVGASAVHISVEQTVQRLARVRI